MTDTANTKAIVWRGWLKMDALARAEASMFKLTGGGGVTPVFELARGRPRSYGASVLHAMRGGEAMCGVDTPAHPDDGCRVVSFWTDERDDVPRCKRCLTQGGGLKR